MAVSIYDEKYLTDEQVERLRELGEAWQRAKARGDSELLKKLKAEGEDIRATAGYHGGADGTQYQPFDRDGADSGGYTAASLPSYVPQTGAVNRLYDAATESRLSELKAAYETSLNALRSERANIPKIYQTQRNAQAAQSELAGRNFNEYAAASGLNSGTAGQAALARSNQLQSGLSQLSAAEGAALSEIGREETRLRTKYADDVAAAVAKGELERAAELLDEYRKAAQSVVDTARYQADEDYRSYVSGR